MTKHTSFRSRKIIPNLEYPISFKCIKEELGDNLDGIESIDIYFSGDIGTTIGASQPGWNNKTIKGETSDLKTFREIIRASYSTTDYIEINLITKSERSQWTINVYLSNKDIIKPTQNFIREVALPIIKDWLNTPRTETWFLNRHILQIGLNESLLKYCVLETQENRIVNKLIKDIQATSYTTPHSSSTSPSRPNDEKI